MLDYYSNNKGTAKNAHSKDEQNQRKRLNYAMKKYIERQIEKEAKNDENVKLGEMIEKEVIDKLTNPVNSSDLNELVSNSRANIKLLQIMSSGVYYSWEKKVRLTQKQRVALSSVLAQVTERQLNPTSKKEVQGRVLQNSGIEME